MGGEKNLETLIANMKPTLNAGEYVFATVSSFDKIPRKDTLFEFKEKEGITVVLEKKKAENLKIPFEFTCSWITLKIHSSLEAVGLTAAFSKALTAQHISCNAVSGFYHDHIFVDTKDAQRALNVLIQLTKN